MARSLLFGTSVSPGIAIGVLRFAHKSRHVLCEYQGLQVNLPPNIFALLAPQVPSTPPTEAF